MSGILDELSLVLAVVGALVFLGLLRCPGSVGGFLFRFLRVVWVRPDRWA